MWGEIGNASAVSQDRVWSMPVLGTVAIVRMIVTRPGGGEAKLPPARMMT